MIRKALFINTVQENLINQHGEENEFGMITTIWLGFQ